MGAGVALALATRGEVTISPTISHVNPDVCIGCGVCIDLCAYGAIEFDARQGVAVVNEALCKGCGNCISVCPTGAADSPFRNRLFLEQALEELLTRESAHE